MRGHFFESSSSDETLEELVAREDKEFIQAQIFKIKQKLIGINDVINGNGASMVHFVASSGDIEAFHWLFINGANIHLKISNGHPCASYSALHLATQKNNIEIVRFLLEKTDTQVDVASSEGITALLIAVDDCNVPLLIY